MTSIDAPPPRWARPRWLAGGVVVLMVVTALVTWLVVGVAHVGRDEARAGTLVRSDLVFTADRHATVTTPSGTVRIDSSTPRPRLPHDVAEFDATGPQVPPADGSWVGVRVETVRVTATAMHFGVPSDNTEVSVVTGGHTYPLSPRADATRYCAAGCVQPDRTVWVAVPGDAADLHFAVAYDGVTQLVDARTGRVTPGRAAPLYATPLVSHPSCGTPAASPGFSARLATCSLYVARLPWVRQLGWAPAGHEWTVVASSVDRPETVVHTEHGHRREYGVLAYAQRYSYALGDASPDTPEPGPLDPTGGSTSTTQNRTVVFETVQGAASQRLIVTGRYGLDARDSAPAAASTMALTWTVSI